MAVAGKVAITPKGEWNADTTYEKLDLVFFENGSYVAIQPSTGVTPTNTAYWMLALQNAGEADLEGIVNGTIQVGNAKSLDGHEAKYFAPLSELANYFKNTGGTVNGDISQVVTDVKQILHRIKNGKRSIILYIDTNGIFRIADETSGKTLFSSTADGVTNTWNGHASEDLSLDGGGTVKSTYIAPIALENTVNDVSLTAYRGMGVLLGYLGMNGQDKPCFQMADGTRKDLLHTGNGATYEEGTFDLTLEGRTLSGYKYTKIGNFVYLSGTVAFNGEPLTIENTTVEVHGLPFGISSIAYIYFGDAIYTPSNKATDNLVNYVSDGTYFGIGGGGTTSFAVGTPCVLHAMYITD